MIRKTWYTRCRFQLSPNLLMFKPLYYTKRATSTCPKSVPAWNFLFGRLQKGCLGFRVWGVLPLFREIRLARYGHAHPSSLSPSSQARSTLAIILYAKFKSPSAYTRNLFLLRRPPPPPHKKAKTTFKILAQLHPRLGRPIWR